MERLGGPSLPARLRDELRVYRVEARRPVVLGLWLPLVEETEDSVVATLAPLLAEVRAPSLSLHGGDPGEGYAAWLRTLLPTAQLEIWPVSSRACARFTPRLAEESAHGGVGARTAARESWEIFSATPLGVRAARSPSEAP